MKKREKPPTAVCAWGFADDVLLNIDGKSFDLSIEEALVLAACLEEAANQALALWKQMQEYMKNQPSETEKE